MDQKTVDLTVSCNTEEAEAKTIHRRIVEKKPALTGG